MRAVIGLIDFCGVTSIYSTSYSFLVLNDCFEKPQIFTTNYHNFLGPLDNLNEDLQYCDVASYV